MDRMVAIAIHVITGEGGKILQNQQLRAPLRPLGSNKACTHSGFPCRQTELQMWDADLKSKNPVRHSSPFAKGEVWTSNVPSAPSRVANANRDSATDWHTRQGVRIEGQHCGDWNAFFRTRGSKEAADCIPWNAKESLSSMGHTPFPRERPYVGTKVSLLIRKGPSAVSTL